MNQNYNNVLIQNKLPFNDNLDYKNITETFSISEKKKIDFPPTKIKQETNTNNPKIHHTIKHTYLPSPNGRQTGQEGDGARETKDEGWQWGVGRARGMQLPSANQRRRVDAGRYLASNKSS